ncbi:putative ABC transport system ATP-binding protein [Inhella inkyongensis]|uniref:Putative ABC transport system ATP-binding protein n=1 Tax=Inhella inkyongensis TaxID=392593 RepID=A0A840S0K8_9BURK|nr:ABC transporter ATP-binding protein [Inhella inkyongensis]MBB5203795.1 putative ABC transport system ATP-binding protein [Inhella inkyongensis]
MNDLMLRCQGLGRSFQLGPDTLPTPALRDVDLQIRRGELVAITGASGSGKSTLLNLIGLLDRPSQGRLWLGGQAVEGASAQLSARLRNRLIGFVFQQFHLLPRHSVWRNVELPLVYAEVSPPERRQRALDLLERLGLAEHAHKRPAQLSGGQQQRVAIARALIQSPPLVLADEPTGALDSATGQAVLQMLRELWRAQGCTVLIVTHDPAIAAQCPRRLHFADGRLVRDEHHQEDLA